MTGGIIQLVAVGALDLYLTGNPQITWFKSIYRRHTEFGFCDMNIKIPDIQFGTTHFINIPRDADLLNKLTLVVDLPSPTMYIKKRNNNSNNRNIYTNKAQIIDELDDYIIITPEKTKEIITTKKIILTANDYVKIKFNNYAKFNKDDIKSNFCLVVKANNINKIFANNYENVYIAHSMPIYNPYKTFANIFNYTYTSQKISKISKISKLYDASQIYEIIQNNIYDAIYVKGNTDIMNEVKFYNDYSLINHKMTNKQYNPKIQDYFGSLVPYNNTISYNAMMDYINANYHMNILSVNINTITHNILEHIVNTVKTTISEEQNIYYENMIQRNKKFKFLFNDRICNKYDFAENILKQYVSNINNIALSTYTTDEIKIIFDALGISNVSYDKKYFIDYISSSIFNKLYTVSDILYNCDCPYFLKNNDVGNYNCINIALYLEQIKNEYMQNEYSYHSIIKAYNMKKNMKYLLQEYKKYTDKILNILINSTIYAELRNGVDMNIRKLSQLDFIDTNNDNFINAIQNTINTKNMYVFTNIDTRKYMPQDLQDICYKYNDFKTYDDIENLVMFDKVCSDKNLSFDIHETKDEIELYNLIVNTTKQKQVISREQPKHAWVRNLGYNLIDEISLIIDGKQIDTQNGELMLLQHKLFDTYEHKRGIDIMMGNIPELYTLSEYIPPAQLYIKFNLFFCKDYGNSLPLVNMAYSSIQIKISLTPIDKLLYVDDTGYIMEPKIKCSLLGTYIYVSSKERFKLSNNYQTLIECYSRSNTIVNPDNLNLRFELNHPCKYLLWKLELLDNKILQIADKIMIEFNSQTREDWQEAKYYQLVQSYNRNINPLDINEGIYIMCLRPEQLQPSGSTNLSCIKNINFNIKINSNITGKIKFTLWACTYNIFAVSNGLSGLLFI